jgi:hypothetical protein
MVLIYVVQVVALNQHLVLIQHQDQLLVAVVVIQLVNLQLVVQMSVQMISSVTTMVVNSNGSPLDM